MDSRGCIITIVAFVIFLFIFPSLKASCADTVKISKRYFVDRTTINGQFYKGKKDNKIRLKIKFGVGGGGFSQYDEDFVCDDIWDWKKVDNASGSIAKFINKNDNIDIRKMLDKAGLKGCKYD